MKKNMTYMLLTTCGFIALAVMGMASNFVFGVVGSYLAIGSLYAFSLALDAPEVFEEDAEVSAFSFFLWVAPFWLVYLVSRSVRRVIEIYSKPA